MELDEELDLQSSEDDTDVGEDHSDINDDYMEGEEDKDGTPELLVLEQAPGAQNNGRAATASIGVGVAGSSTVWSVAGSSAGGAASRSAGGFAGKIDGGTQDGRTGDRNVGTGKDLTAAAAKVRQRVKDWGMSTPSETKATIWQKGWFKVYDGKNMTDVAIYTLCVKQEAWKSCEVGYGKSMTSTNSINHFNTDRPGHRERYQTLKGLGSPRGEGTITTFVRPTEEQQTEAPLQFIITISQSMVIFRKFP